MYVLLTITDDDYTFQLKEEDGTDIGSPSTFNNTDYRVDREPVDQFFYVFPAEDRSKAWPPVAGYPMSRTIITYTP